MSLVDSIQAEEVLEGSYVPSDTLVTFAAGGKQGDVFTFPLSKLRRCDGGANVLYCLALASLSHSHHLSPQSLASVSRSMSALTEIGDQEGSDALRGFIDFVTTSTTSLTTRQTHRSEYGDGHMTVRPISNLPTFSPLQPSSIFLDVEPTVFRDVAMAVLGHALYYKAPLMTVQHLILVREMATRLHLSQTVESSFKPPEMMLPACITAQQQRVKSPEPEPVIILDGPLVSSQSQVSSPSENSAARDGPNRSIDATIIDTATSGPANRVLVSAHIVNQYVSAVETSGRHTWRFNILKGADIRIGVAAPGVLRAGVDVSNMRGMATISSQGMLNVHFFKQHSRSTPMFGAGSVVRVTVDFSTQYIYFEVGRKCLEIFRFDAPQLAAVVSVRNQTLVECFEMTVDDVLLRAHQLSL